MSSGLTTLAFAEPALDPGALSPVTLEGLYVHVPFCFHKCHYCDFYSITRQSPERMARFVDLVLYEAQLWSAAGHVRTALTTVFFGGGTPSLLPRDQMQRLISGLRDRFDCSGVREWTSEANPATVDAEYCRMLVESGVNRISFGAQSFNRSELAVLERHHDPDDVPRSVEVAYAAGLNRINVDLIYAIPGQSLKSWSETLEAAIALGLEHLSCYGLTYEPNTPIAVRRRLGQLNAAEESAELSMLHHTRERLSDVGLPAYEISNYARPGRECRHNLMYWTGGSYLGLGPSAASHLAGTRFRNRPHLGEWERAVETGALPAIEVEHLGPRQRAGELAMLMLRLDRGLRFPDFAARTGLDARELFSATLARMASAGLVEVSDTCARLTRAGLNVADSVAAEFLTA